MNSYVIVSIVIVALFLLFFFKEYFDSKRRFKKLIDEANEAFGSFSSKRFTPDEMLNIKKLFERYKNEDAIDDITASDLELDEIYNRFNICLSAPGRDYLYYLMRSPEYSEEALNNLEKKISAFENNTELRNKIRPYFHMIGDMKRANFFDCLDYFDTISDKNLFTNYLCSILIVLSIGLVFFFTGWGVLALVGSLIFAILSYYSERGVIEAYIICFKYIVNFIKYGKKICNEDIPEIQYELDSLREICEEIKALEKGATSLGSGGSTIGTGNPFEIFGDYGRMIFHLDIIRFYKMLRVIKEKRGRIEELYIVLGKIETYINLASIRKAFPAYCVPKRGEGLKGENLYHPLITDPVKNSISTTNGVLITGSNASGKSTFLKTVALNVLFANTIHTCTADSFSIDDYRMFSSMSLRDDILNNDSYFMVEIKALKRIFDFKNSNPDKKTICFVDEVLRGTNTVERIAACTQILKNLKAIGVLTFAATHDIELTELLMNDYDNYHFDEEIKNDDVLFNYLIKPGKATSKNAIKLLSIMGFSDDIVSKAQSMADDFTDNGIWRG